MCTGPIHFLIYSTEAPFTVGTPQYQCASYARLVHAQALMNHGQQHHNAYWARCSLDRFIASDLAGVNRCVTPWIVAAAHRPFYADSTDFTGE